MQPFFTFLRFFLNGTQVNRTPKRLIEDILESCHKIVHDYFGIDNTIVWQIKETYLPSLIEKLSNLIL